MKNLPTLIVLGVIVLGVGLLIANRNFLQESSPTINNSPSSSQDLTINKVTFTKDGFLPASLTIKKGEAVMWINESSVDATVNSNPHPTHKLYRFLNLGEVPPGSSVQAVFEKTGTFGYHNHLNPGQQGTIVVK